MTTIPTNPKLVSAIVRITRLYADFQQETGLTPTILLVSPECILATMNVAEIYNMRVIIDDASRSEMTCAYAK